MARRLGCVATAVAVNTLILIQDAGIVGNDVVVQLHIAIPVMDTFTDTDA